MSAASGHTLTDAVTGFGPHHLSFATRTTAPSEVTSSSLYGPDDGKRLRSRSGDRFQMVFQDLATRSMVGPSPACRAVAPAPSPRPRSSAMTCDGIIEVAAKSWP